MARKLKYLDLETLKKINYVSDKLLKYNRTLPESILNTIPEGLFMVVIPLLVHEHRAGEPADPHMRCRIYDGTDRFLLLDIEMGLYDLLPEQTVSSDDDDNAPENNDNAPDDDANAPDDSDAVIAQ